MRNRVCSFLFFPGIASEAFLRSEPHLGRVTRSYISFSDNYFLLCFHALSDERTGL
jgi:hypothetical protein